ncbi:MAG: dockerin type I repeat-containing protein [Ruminococcus callidus]
MDMDGVITGHDAAVVSRYLHVDNTLLNADQLALADVNGDGVVDQADADWIHENEEVELVPAISVPNPTSLFYQLVYIANTGAGNHFTIVDEIYPLSRFLTLKSPRKL